LIPGSTVRRLTPRTIGVNDVPGDRPYIEEHKGERGVVFFPSSQTAKRYQKASKLSRWQLALIPHPEAVVSISMQWGCKVAYSIRVQGEGFRRDVTEIVREPEFVPDGQHRHGQPSR